MNKVLGSVFIMAAVFLLIRYWSEPADTKLTGKKKLAAQITRDIEETLEKEGYSGSNGIHHFILADNPQDAKKLLADNPIKLQTYDEATNWLEIEVIALPDAEDPGLVIQVSVFKTKTSNKTSEFAKAYRFKQFGVSKPNSP